MDIQDSVYVVTRAKCSHTVTEHRTALSGTTYFDGTVRTVHGIIEVLGEKEEQFQRVDFVWRGRYYIRSVRGKSVSKRGLIRLAHAFAASIAAKRKR